MTVPLDTVNDIRSMDAAGRSRSEIARMIHVDILKKPVIERRGRAVARLNLSPSSHLLLFEIEAGSHPSAFRSANTALSRRFSIWSSLSPASGPVAGGA